MRETALLFAIVAAGSAYAASGLASDSAADDPPPLQFSLTYVATLGGSYSTANAINSEGDIAGEASTALDRETHAIIYSHGNSLDLGTLGTDSTGYGINDQGEVAGVTDEADEFEHGFFYGNGSMVDVGNFGGQSSVARAINNQGLVVGSAAVAMGHKNPRAFVYSRGVLTDLGITGSANAINERGQIAGTGTFPTGPHAFLYQKGIVMDLGVPDGPANYATDVTAMNNEGDVVGIATSRQEDVELAFLYHRGKMVTLPPLPGALSAFSLANGINDSGQIVGNAGNVNRTDIHPFLYLNGKMLDLNSLIDDRSPLKPYVTLIDAEAINNSCWIAANGTDSRTGNLGGYLLKPVPSTQTPCSSKTAPIVHPSRSPHGNQ